MKILVVGYACNPYGGSEPGVGWTAVGRIAKRHDVCVLTDVHNKAGWEKGAKEGIIPANVRVRFLQHIGTCSENRFIAHMQSWLNYAAFNRQVLAAAQAWHAKEKFDLCHQVTVAAWRMPSPLWRLPVPFVWGPIGGAGYIPHAFRSMLSPSARLFERARDISTVITSRSQAFRQCIRNAAVVIAANDETEVFLKAHRKERALLRIPVTPFPVDKTLQFRRSGSVKMRSGPLRLFAGGNMGGSKGLDLALRALAHAHRAGIDFHYTIAGGGPDIRRVRVLASTLGIESKVMFHPGFQGEDYVRELHSTDVYFLPSFRETMGMTLVEAIFAGCYPVVADASAQGEIVRMAGGKAIAADTQETMILGLAEAIIWCDRNRENLTGEAAKAASLIAEYLSSERYDASLEQAYEIAVKLK